MKKIKTYDINAIKAIPILDYLKGRGIEVKNNRCAATWRNGDNSQAVSISPDKNLWFDFVVGDGGTVIDLCMNVENLTFADARRELGKRFDIQQTDVPITAPAPKQPPKPDFIRVGWAIKNKDISNLDETDLPVATRILELANGATDDETVNKAIGQAAAELTAATASEEDDELPPRFGEPSPDFPNAEYSSFIGKARMPDGDYYPFSVTAADGSLFASIQSAQKAVAGDYTAAHAQEKGFSIKASDLREVMPLCVVMWLRSCGCFYRSAETRHIEDLMFFNRKDGRLLRMNSDEFEAWLSNGARVNRADKEFQRLLAFVQDAGMSAEVSVETMPNAFVARRDDAVYISCGESDIVRCKAGRCELVRNGTDGVLFPCEHTLKKWQLLPDEKQVRDPFETTMQFNDLAYATWYGKYLLRAWYLNLFAGHANHTPLLLTGDRNSGKTATARAIREMVGFPKREAAIDPKKEEDFWVSVNGRGLLLFDNVEEEIRSAKWLNSAIEKVTTGGGKEVRKLYTQSSTVYDANSDIIFASKIPYYAANEGVAHRFVIVNLDAHISKYRGDELLKEIIACRDEAMTWTARTVARALVARADVPANVNERYPDFGYFSLQCAKVLDDYDNALTALQCGEFEKSRIVLVNDATANEIYQFLVARGGEWEGELMEIARWSFAEAMSEGEINEDNDAANLRRKAMQYSHAIKRLRRPFEICFKSLTMAMRQGRTRYCFGGLNDLIKGNL